MHSTENYSKIDTISKHPTSWEDAVKLVLLWLEENYPSMSRTSIKSYGSTMRVVCRRLENAKLPTLPWEIDRITARMFIDDMYAEDLQISTMKNYAHGLTKYCDAYGNYVMHIFNQTFGADERKNADWLIKADARTVLYSADNPTLRLIVHCELVLGMRRIEVVRMLMSYPNDSSCKLTVKGKGSRGGKLRDVPYMKSDTDTMMDTKTVFHEYLTYRDALVKLAKTKNPTVIVPDEILIYNRGLELHKYSEEGTGIDRMMNDYARSIGVKFSNHTLRRTFGRTAYGSGMDILVLSQILGHSSIKQTLLYIGYDGDKNTSEMQKLNFDD